MAKGLYVGRAVEPGSGKPGAKLELDPTDLLTHGLIVGMTGSGKTGLAIVLLEELLRQGVPVIAIDPKGDLANLLLLFDKLEPAQFEPWIDAAAARREGKDAEGRRRPRPPPRGRRASPSWGLGAAEIAALKKTPRRRRLHARLERRRAAQRAAVARGARGLLRRRGEEDLRDEIQSIVTGLLTLVGSRPTRCSRRPPSSSRASSSTAGARARASASRR